MTFFRSVPPSRRLTPQEVLLLQELFGPALATETVRVHGRSFLPGLAVPMAPFGTVYFPRRWFRDDYAILPARDAGLTALRLFNTFVHEMVHVWQWQNGACVAWRGALASLLQWPDRGRAYPYPLPDGVTLANYGLEQQASLLADYCTLCRWPNHPALLRLLMRDNLAASQAATHPDGLAWLRARFEAVLAPFLSDPACYRGQPGCLGRIRPLR